jgi:heme O synthase-like polyprenyltransferase
MSWLLTPMYACTLFCAYCVPYTLLIKRPQVCNITW